MIGLNDTLMDHVRVATYDGDTSKEERSYARSHANVIITNPGIAFLESQMHPAKVEQASEDGLFLRS